MCVAEGAVTRQPVLGLPGLLLPSAPWSGNSRVASDPVLKPRHEGDGSPPSATTQARSSTTSSLRSPLSHLLM